MPTPTLEQKFLGGMIGSALGDAVGEIAFHVARHGITPDSLQNVIQQMDMLSYTDDTAMAIGIAECITTGGNVEEQRLGDIFSANYDREPWRGYAFGPPTLFRTVKQKKITYREAARQLFNGEGSFGNGAAMRITPIGLFYYDDVDLYGKVEMAAAVTHAHLIAIDGAAILALAVAEAVKLDPAQEFPRDDLLRKLREFARTEEMRKKMREVEELVVSGAPCLEAAQRLCLSVATHESVPFAIFSFFTNPKSYDKSVYGAIATGGDRDTMGAMAGGIAGAYVGLEGIPTLWRNKLENRTYMEELAKKMYGLRQPESA